VPDPSTHEDLWILRSEIGEWCHSQRCVEYGCDQSCPSLPMQAICDSLAARLAKLEAVVADARAIEEAKRRYETFRCTDIYDEMNARKRLRESLAALDAQEKPAGELRPVNLNLGGD
jgi:hypothetical protein